MLTSGRMLSPTFVSEAELDDRFNTKTLIKSGGNYGLHCAVFDGDLDDADDPTLGGGWFFCDEWIEALGQKHPKDIGTLLVTGNVRSTKALLISDRLTCLVVLGSVEAPALSVFETEMYVGTDVTVGELHDPDNYLTVKGKRTVTAAE